MSFPLDELHAAFANAIGTWVAILAAGGAMYIQNLTTKRISKVQLAFNLHQQYDSEFMQKARSELAQYILRNPDSKIINDCVLVFLENASSLYRRNLVDKEVFWNVFSFDVSYYYLACQNHINYQRKKYNDSSWYEEIEYCHNKLSHKLTSPLRGMKSSKLNEDKDTLNEFLLMEALRARE